VYTAGTAYIPGCSRRVPEFASENGKGEAMTDDAAAIEDDSIPSRELFSTP
jgi:hypothetical protein